MPTPDARADPWFLLTNAQNRLWISAFRRTRFAAWRPIEATQPFAATRESPFSVDVRAQTGRTEPVALAGPHPTRSQPSEHVLVAACLERGGDLPVPSPAGRSPSSWPGPGPGASSGGDRSADGRQTEGLGSRLHRLGGLCPIVSQHQPGKGLRRRRSGAPAPAPADALRTGAASSARLRALRPRHAHGSLVPCPSPTPPLTPRSNASLNTEPGLGGSSALRRPRTCRRHGTRRARRGAWRSA